MSEVYTNLVVSILIIWLLYKLLFPQRKLLFCILVGIALFIVLGLRNVEKGLNVGVDLIRYANHYDEVKFSKDIMTASMHDLLYPAYWVVNYIAALLNLTFQQFSTFTALVCVSSLVFYISRNAHNSLLAFFTVLGMGVFTFWFSGLKQAYAMAASLLFFDAFLRGKIKSSTIWLTVSVLFHWASLVLLPILIVGRIRMSKVVAFSYFIALFLITMFSMRFGQAITALLVESYEGNYVSSGSVGASAILSIIIMLLFVFFIYDKSKPNLLVLLHGLLILCMIQLAASYSYAFTRVNLFYMNGIMAIVISMLGDKVMIKVKSRSARKVVSVIFSLVWISLMIYLFNRHIVGEQLEDYHFISSL